MKRDRASTKWRQSSESGPMRFLDKRSYMGSNGHEYLFGKDRSARRHEKFEQCKGICEVCNFFAPEHGYPGMCGELHHEGCYCLPCVGWRCGQLIRPCHRHRTLEYVRKHGRLARARAEIAKEFNAKEKSDGN